MFDWLTGLFSTANAAAAGAQAANAAQSAMALQKLANIGTLVGGLGSAYGSIAQGTMQNDYAKKMLNLQEENIAYQKEKEKKKQASFDLAAANALGPTVTPKLNLGA